MAMTVATSIETKAQGPRRVVESIPPDLRAAVDQSLAEVVAAAAQGDSAAWEHLSKRFGNMILAIARSCRLGDADVGDVFQTTWLRLVENVGRIEQPERIGAWLATTARRESLRLVRGRARVTFDTDSFEYLPDVNTPSVDAPVLAEERSAAVREAYAKLPPRCQKLLGLLAGSDPPSYQDVSRILDMPIGSIGPTRGRCLEHLRKILLEATADI
jgi:RNA polymerase sigma factor (sigma-70 family)